MRALTGLVVTSLALGGACTQSLDGARCPCADGYHCCETQNVCVRDGVVCETPAQGGAGSGSGGMPGEAGAAPTGGQHPAAGGGGLVSTAGVGGNVSTGAGKSGDGGRAGSSSGAPGTSGGGSTGATAGGMDSGGESAGGAAGDATEAPPFVRVLTQHNDSARTGANLNETTLDVGNVREDTFGEVSRRPLRGAVFAEPLVVPEVELAGGARHDVLVVATMANMLYALDAQHPELAPLWTQSLGASVVLPNGALPDNTLGIWHEVGILGTPVIAADDNAVYAVAASASGDVSKHTLYKLDLATGAVRQSVTIAADGFDSSISAQRAALTLSDGVVYVPFGPYRAGTTASGWVFAFDRELTPLDHVQLGNPSGSGVTMNGDGPAVGESGSLYFTTGRGGDAWDEAAKGYGTRVLELDGAAALRVTERLLPDAAQSQSDELVSSGPLLVPGTGRLVVAGQHRIYTVETSVAASLPTMPLQEFRASTSSACDVVTIWCSGEPSSPVFWPGSGAEPVPRLFVWSPNELLRAFAFDPAAGRFNCDGGDLPCTALTSAAPSDSYDADNHALEAPGHLSVSSNGTKSGTGIVWALQPYAKEIARTPDSILRAFDAEHLKSLWTSATEPLGAAARGALPTVSGGHAFVGTVDGVSNKHVFWGSDESGPPALTNFGEQLLVVAWGFYTSQSQGFQLSWSRDGVTFDDASTILTDFWSPEPALAAHGDHLYFAWATARDGVKVVSSSDPSFVDYTALVGPAQSAPDYASGSAPSLTYGDDRLFLAWHSGNGLEVVSSDDGVTFDETTRVTLPGYLSYSSPLLSYLDGKLYLATTGLDDQVKLFVSSDDGAHFDGPTLLPILSSGHPALLSVDVGDAASPDQVLIWSDVPDTSTSQGFIVAATRSGGAPSNFARLHHFQEDSAERSISAARFHDHWYISWMGTGGTPQPNVARYSTGELVSYGLLAR